MPSSSIYLFSDQDTDLLLQNGFQLIGVDDPNKFSKLLNSDFPGFDLRKWIEQIEKLLTPLTTSPIKRTIFVSKHTLRIRIVNQFNSEDDALIFDRKFIRSHNNLSVSHEYLIVPEFGRKQGIARRMLGISLPFYQRINVQFVKVIAGLSTGAYVWAKCGFVATSVEDTQRILTIAQGILMPFQFRLVEMIFTSYYTRHPRGQAFPMKTWADLPFMKKVLLQPECQWEGIIDLKNPEQLRKLEEYVGATDTI